MSIEHHTAELPAVRLHYLLAGHGPALLLLHGWPQSSHEWRLLIPELAKRYRVIAPDLRGLGDSGRPVGGYDKMTIAGDLRVLLRDKLGITQTAVVGHDWGGAVAYALAAQDRALVTRLAILDMLLPGVELPGLGPDALSRYWHFGFHGVRDLPEMLVAGRERAYISWFFQNFAYNPRAITEADVDEYARCLAQPGALRAGFEYYRAAGQDAVDFAATARERLAIPVLALGGERSIGAAVRLCMEQVANDVRGGVIERCGHWIAEEQPQALRDALLAFLGEA
ncbi:alpha/beta fold hydrolase [Immundisolibacter sp.]|uniref:alpha/beta fold hydrolase n=1 Tax=Immundisolibacter sp. TaxID=1934948 RepID=UPI003563350E